MVKGIKKEKGNNASTIAYKSIWLNLNCLFINFSFIYNKNKKNKTIPIINRIFMNSFQAKFSIYFEISKVIFYTNYSG